MCVSFLLLVLALVGKSQAKPGVLDFLLGSDECKPITDDSCAIVYDDEDCGEGTVLFDV